MRPRPWTNCATSASLAALLGVSLLVALYRFVATEVALESGAVRSVPSFLLSFRRTDAPFVEPLEYTAFFSDYECVGWRQTGACSPDGAREPEKDLPCDAPIRKGRSGYCEFRLKTDNSTTRRALPVYCDTLRPRVAVRCDEAPEYLAFGVKSTAYVHDAGFGYDKNQHALLASNEGSDHVSFARGIVMVVYEDILVSAYASIRSLREMGTTLPIELWYNPSETDSTHPVMAALDGSVGVYKREIADERATRFFTKLHAVFYSAFDQVLLMDADNFAVRDPAFLFDTAEFNATGAVFWPDFWRPSQTIFELHDRSLAWQIFGIPFVDMFEQESGQVLIDRRRHLSAMNVMMYYGFTVPRIQDQLRLVWGDKDLFRFAWLKTHSSFHMIARPPGSAGLVHERTLQFCGLAMVQHDAQGEILFIHRNTIKLKADPASREVQWTYVQQLRADAPIDKYDIKKSSRIVRGLPRCWGKPDNDSAFHSVTAIGKFPFGGIEHTLLRHVDEAVSLERPASAGDQEK